jgi:Xaa-Pro dipeptidase
VAWYQGASASKNTKFVFSDSLAAVAPALRLVNGTAITAGCRMIKSEHEVALMRRPQATGRYEAVFQALHPA